MKDDWVWVSNQASEQIEIYNPATTDWNPASAMIFWFKPLTSNNYSQYAVDHWGPPSDFKVRNVSAWGGNHLVAAGGGLVTIATYPGKKKKWAYNLGGHPHGVELLPNGNIAVAATEKDSVLLFASSTGTDNLTHAVGSHNKAHAVLYEPVENILWSIGNDYIKAFQVGGTDAQPTLKELTNRAGNLKLTGNIYGHDLSADLNDSNLLWFSTNHNVYSFNKVTKEFTAGPGGTTGIDKSFVKGISRQNSGIFVITRQDSAKNPPPADPVLNPEWCTRYVDFYSSTGAFLRR